MSLKAFHIFFITASSALAFGFGAWEVKGFFSPEGRGVDLAFGIASFLVGVGLILYGRYFLKKLKNVGYL
jgi:hypothetical protein